MMDITYYIGFKQLQLNEMKPSLTSASKPILSLHNMQEGLVEETY